MPLTPDTLSGAGDPAARVLLLSCYDLGHQPLALAHAAAFLAAAGCTVRAIDTAVEPLEGAAVDDADVVAISVPMHTAMRLAVDAIDVVQARRPQLPIVLFGLYAPLCADLLPTGTVVAGLGGEVESALVDTVTAAAHRSAGTPPTLGRVVLDRLRFPAPRRDLLPPLERYARLLVDGESRLTGYVEAARGCVHRCRHCPVPVVYDGRIRVMQLDTMLDDVTWLVQHGARHLTFGDPDFLNSVPWALQAARAVHDRFPHLTFDATVKIEHLLEHPDAVRELRDLGLLFVVSAVETTSDHVLRLLDKGHTHAQTLQALRLTRALGIELRPSLLPFTPWSTLEDYLRLLDFILDEDLLGSVDPVHLGIRLLVPPGSLVLDLPEFAAHRRPERDAPGTFSLAWAHPDPRMDDLQEQVAAITSGVCDADVASLEAHRQVRAASAQAARHAGIDWDPRLDDVTSIPHRARLSESWFCCAEPTARQRDAVSVRVPMSVA